MMTKAAQNDAKETKHDRFARMAEARTSKIISMARLLGNLSNTSVYEYTNKDIDKIFNAIGSAVSDARKRFELAHDGTQAFKLG